MHRRADSLSVVVPLYQEALGVARLKAGLDEFATAERARRDVDFVLVDDGSTDGTAAALRERFDGRDDVKILVHEHNRGLTAALATGSAAARGHYIGWLDSDLSYDPSILSAMCEQLDDGADVSTASCYHPDGCVEGVVRWRLWLSTLASRCYRRLTKSRLHTFTCMVRVMRTEMFQRCQPERGGFLGVTESLLRAIRAGADVREMPATLRSRQFGQSKMRVLRVGFGHLGLMGAWLRRRL